MTTRQIIRPIIGENTSGVLKGISSIPQQIQPLTSWFDASDAGTLTIDGSNRVSQWDDKGLAKLNSVQGTLSLQPIYDSTGFNGKPTVGFIDKQLISQILSDTYFAASGFTLFMAVNTFVPLAGAQGTSIVSVSPAGIPAANSSNNHPNLSLGTDAPRFIRAAFSDARSIISRILPGDFPLVYTCIYEGGGVGRAGFNDDTLAVRTDILNCTNSTYQLFLGGSGCAFNISELLIYNKVLSSEERTTILNYLSNKWDITL